MFPWGCASEFLKRIVPDAAPQHGLTNGIPHLQKPKEEKFDHMLLTQKKIEDDHDQTLLDRTLNNNQNNKSASLLVQRIPSTGERVL